MGVAPQDEQRRTKQTLVCSDLICHGKRELPIFKSCAASLKLFHKHKEPKVFPTPSADA